MTAQVCVTGCNGFIGAQIAREMLEHGYRVHGTVRSLGAKHEWLLKLPGAAERLQLFSASLQDDDAYDAAVRGCDYVIHTASPYLLKVKNPQAEMVEPAVQGTLNVLRAAHRAGSVRRVVLTSSLAAVTDEPDDAKVFSEEDWNKKSSLKRNVYFYSKTQAEQAAWKFLKQHDATFDLVAINPCVVIGPSLGPALNESNKILSDMLAGVYPGIMAINFCMVDVRDVATAHRLALTSTAAQGRYITCSDGMSMAELITFLGESGYQQYKLPKLDMSGTAGTLLMKLASYTQPKGAGDFIRSHIGKTMRISNQKICRDLGIEFRPLRASILDAITDMIQWGHITPPAPASGGR